MEEGYCVTQMVDLFSRFIRSLGRRGPGDRGTSSLGRAASVCGKGGSGGDGGG